MPMMSYTKKPGLSYLLYAIYAIAMAVIYGLFTYFGIFARGTDGFALRTYIWNLVLITIVLLVDRLYLVKLKKSAEKRVAANRKARVLHFVSFKASLYLFYIFALTTSRLLLLLDGSGRFEVGNIYNFRSYLLSIEYGLILLVAADKFIGQFIYDKKTMRELAEK
ncbi:MAG: hypothetical protein FWC73_07200 [Defluviitaleaceae bacterium]|nr:hypothetical protein [Defluviitaleaceae bacterium]